MRKFIIAFAAFCFMGWMQYANAQVTVTMSSVTVAQNGTAAVDISVSGFTNILSAQFSINYDSSVLQFQSFTNFSTALPGLNSSAVSGPNGVGVLNGQATFSWFDPMGLPRSLPNNTRLFTMNFRAIGNPCTMSEVFTSNIPLQIEIANQNSMVLTLTNIRGTVTVQCDGPVNPCPDPVCANMNSLRFSGAQREAKPGSNVCIPITMTNFNMMQSGQGVISWNPTLLSFTEVKNLTALPGLDGTINANDAPNGRLIYLWSNPTPGTPLTLPANTVFMELCFNVVGPVGQTACLIMGQGNPPTEWTNNSGEVPICYNYGRVRIVDETIPRVTIKAPNVEGCKDSILCVDIRVDSFTNMTGMQFSLQWNPAVLQYVSTGMYDLEGLTAGAFTNTNDKLRVSWISPNGLPVTKANNHKIFQLCFRLIGACDATSPLNFVDVIEFIGTGPSALPHQTVAGSVRVKCDCAPNPPVCTLGTITNPTCNGDTNGSINMSVTNADNNCDCIWKRADGTVIKNNKVTAGCNLTGVGAGTYTFELVCNGNVLCTNTATLTQPQVLTIPTAGAVTNASCGAKGSITVNPTGGTPPYTYNWNPAQGNIPNPGNLDPGVYALTVSDSRGCSATASFTVGDAVQDLNVTSTKTDVRCRGGNNGTISLTVTGGCPPYNFNWTGNLSGQNPGNLTAGTYSVTVSDNDNPANTRVVSVTITEPATSVAVQVTGTTQDTPPNSGTGSISILASGGTPDYTLTWGGGPTNIPSGNTNGAFTAGSVRAGTYSVTVTDRNGCTATAGNIIVMPGDTMPTPRAPRIGTAGVATNFNGFSVPCNGNCNAVISTTITEGTLPITAVLRRSGSNIQTLTVNALGEIRFTGVCAGSYTVSLTNSVGSVTSPAITVTQPSRLAATTDIKCTDGDADNGRIQVDLNNTGVPPYTFNWIGLASTTNVIDNLRAGTYSVSITDANDCVLLIGNMDVNNCDDTENCYKALPVITPNGDNRNDLFVINCARQNPGDLTVFDRFGRIVYTQNNYDNTWSGLDRNNNVLPEGAYMWVLDVNFGQGRREIYKGTVTILR